MKFTTLIKGTNHFFIVDEIGMASTFPLMKDQLVTNINHHVTIVYYSSNSYYTFKKEMIILERLFPLQFIVFYEMNTNNTKNFNTDDLESLLNSNVMENLIFTVSGNSTFNKLICNKLHFLGINNIDIKELLFK